MSNCDTPFTPKNDLSDKSDVAFTAGSTANFIQYNDFSAVAESPFSPICIPLPASGNQILFMDGETILFMDGEEMEYLSTV